VMFLDVMTGIIPDWKAALNLPVPQGPEGTKTLEEMKRLRSRMPVSLTAAALNALGLVSQEILNETGMGPKEKLQELLEDRLEPLREIKWNREDDFWQGNIVQSVAGADGLRLNIKTQTTPIRQAAQKMLALIGKKGQLI